MKIEDKEIVVAYNPWSLYWPSSIQQEAERFSIRRCLEFLESPDTGRIKVKEPIQYNEVEITLHGRCPDEENPDFDHECQFTVIFGKDELDEEEKKRVLTVIGIKWPGKNAYIWKMKGNAAKALGLPRFYL